MKQKKSAARKCLFNKSSRSRVLSAADRHASYVLYYDACTPSGMRYYAAGHKSAAHPSTFYAARRWYIYIYVYRERRRQRRAGIRSVYSLKSDLRGLLPIEILIASASVRVVIEERLRGFVPMKDRARRATFALERESFHISSAYIIIPRTFVNHFFFFYF